MPSAGYIIVLLLCAIAILLWLYSRKQNYYEDPVKARGRYIILNKFTGHICYEGRTFRTRRGAIRAARPLGSGLFGISEWLEVRKVV